VFGRPLTLGVLVTALMVGRAPAARAEETTSPDAGAAAIEEDAGAPKRVRWHDSTLLVYQRVTTVTVGVGADYQSRNPFYDVLLYFRPRYYLWEQAPSSLSLRAELIGSHEFTNSDGTTDRGEYLLEDSVLSLVPEHAFGSGDDRTLVTVSIPRLVLPTSKASFRSGKIVELGARVLVDQGVPLRVNQDLLPRGRVGVRAGYAYQLATGTVPDSDTVSRLRMNLDGVLVRNGQLGGAAFSEHVGVLRGIVGADIYLDRLSFELELGVDPAYKRELAPAVVRNLQTGPFQGRSIADPQRFVVNTYLDASLTLSVKDLLRIALGYENVTRQLGEDGQRRSVLYSPEAKFYLAAELTLDRAYESVTGRRRTKAVAATD
jgi:hypothetical protein